MKRIMSLFLLLALSCAVLLTGCGGKEKLPAEEMLLFQPMYIGEDVTDTDHVFTKEDFLVTALYTEDRTVEITDFDFEVKGLKDGKYTIVIEYDGVEQYLFVDLVMPIYPSEMASQ